MNIKPLKLNSKQTIELSKIFLDIGKAAFLASVAGYFIPPLVERDVELTTLALGLLSSLTSITIGLILLRKG
jgi:hypothetical protein